MQSCKHAIKDNGFYSVYWINHSDRVGKLTNG